MELICTILGKTASIYPNKEALVYKNKRYTYREIHESSVKLASFLRAKGIHKGDRVGIFSSKNIEEIIAIFAILKVGGIFVHINPHFKEDQLSYIVSDCNLKTIFVHGSKGRVFQKAFPDKNQFNRVIYLSSEMDLGYQQQFYLSKIISETETAEFSPSGIMEDDPAAIIYTSGSTGKPKGIVVTQKIFYDSTVASVKVLENNPNDRLISVTPFSFDGALSQLYTAIYTGATLVLNESNFPKDIVKTMLEEKITGFHAVPSFWRMLLQEHSPFPKNQYPDLRYVSIIGESFPQDDLMKLRSVLNKTKFYMMYGITEAFRSTFLHPDDFERKMPSIGKPFPGVEISIANDKGNQCDPGEIGEIVHKGSFVSPGYWNDPERTRRIFKNGSLYTGDLGKIDPEGYIYFVGRKDNMIKYMGYRISPEEIEECVYKINGIKEAAVITIRDEESDLKIKLVISCEDGFQISSTDVINHCKSYLPYYMVPHILEFVAEMPKTGTFKINRSQLK